MKESYKEFVKQIIFWGRFTLLAAWICSFLPPLYLAVVSGCSLWDHARGYKYRQSILHDRFRNAGKLDRRTDCLFPDRRDYGDVYVMAGRKYFQYACTGIGAFTDSRRC